MNFLTNKANMFNGVIQIKLPSSEYADELNAHIQKGETLSVEIKKYRQKRSLDANGLMWLALQHLAMVHNTTKDELYIMYLRNYGIFDYIAILEEAYDRVSSLYRIVDKLGTFKTDKGVEMLKLKVYPGSSTYDTKEFSYLLERILEDACKCGFTQLAPKDIESMLDERRKQ